MKPCYNYVLLNRSLYRIDLNNATVGANYINSPKFFIGDLECDQPTMDDACRFLNVVNDRNNLENINFIRFHSPVGDGLGMIDIAGNRYAFSSERGLCNTLYSVPERVRPARSAVVLTALREFIKASYRFKAVKSCTSGTFVYNDVRYDIDDIGSVFPDYRPEGCSTIEILRNLNIFMADREICKLPPYIVEKNGNLRHGGDVYELRKSRLGKYYLRCPLHRLLDTCNANAINDAVKLNLPPGMRRIGVFPEFDSVDMLYRFVEGLIGVKLKYESE